MIYVDANVFAFAVLASDKQGVSAQDFLESIEKGRHAITSALVLDELMWVLRKNRHPELIPNVIEDIYATENLEVKEVPAHIPLNALRFIEKHNLKPRDAFHAAIMEHFNISEIATDDKDFDKIKGIKRIRI